MSDEPGASLIPFEFESNTIRVHQDQQGELWWVAKDVCEALSIRNPRQALSRLDNDEKGVISMDTHGGTQEISIINEAGLYGLILGSRKPEVKAFKRWIKHDVIPSIRKTGQYSLTKSTSELARFDLMQLMLDEQRRAAGERAKLAARQDALETDVQSLKADRPPAGKYLVEEWLRTFSKPYLPKPMLKNLKAFCKDMEDAERWRPGWSEYRLPYYTPETIERAYALVTKQISFIEEAGVSYGNGKKRNRHYAH